LIDEEYFDLEARLKKIQAAAAALEEQKLEKLLYTYKQVRAVYITLFCFARFQKISFFPRTLHLIAYPMVYTVSGWIRNLGCIDNQFPNVKFQLVTSNSVGHAGYPLPSEHFLIRFVQVPLYLSGVQLTYLLREFRRYWRRITLVIAQDKQCRLALLWRKVNFFGFSNF
jgi:hypothetical protein